MGSEGRLCPRLTFPMFQQGVQQGLPALEEVLEGCGVSKGAGLRCLFSPASQSVRPISLPDPTPPTMMMLGYWGRGGGGLGAAK